MKNMSSDMYYERLERDKGHIVRELPDDFTIVDIETTGLDFDFDEIIEYGAIKVRNGKEVARYSSLVKSELGIYDPYITKLTGITNEMLEDAPSPEETTLDLLDFIGDDIVCGHRMAYFDINFIYDAVIQYAGQAFRNNYIDTYNIANRLFGKSLGNLKLETIANHFGVDYSSAHRAVQDCEITLQCYKKLKETALEKYGSEEAYVKTFRKRSGKVDTGLIVAEDDSMLDEDSLIYGKEVCITGELQRMQKRDAYQMIANIGGIPNDKSVTKNCAFLVVSDDMYLQIAAGRKPTKKIEKARENKAKGLDIEIISEGTLYGIFSSMYEINDGTSNLVADDNSDSDEDEMSIKALIQLSPDRLPVVQHEQDDFLDYMYDENNNLLPQYEVEEKICTAIVALIEYDRPYSGVFEIRHRSQDYTTLNYSGTDLIRIKWRKLSKWIKVSMRSQMMVDDYINNPMFKDQINKKEYMWIVRCETIDDLEKVVPVIIGNFYDIEDARAYE